MPQKLTHTFRVIILADTAFGSVKFLQAMRQRRYPVMVGVRYDRKLSDGRQVCDLGKKGQQVKLDGLSFPVTTAWFYLKRNGKLEKRFVLLDQSCCPSAAITTPTSASVLTVDSS